MFIEEDPGHVKDETFKQQQQSHIRSHTGRWSRRRQRSLKNQKHWPIILDSRVPSLMQIPSSAVPFQITENEQSRYRHDQRHLHAENVWKACRVQSSCTPLHLSKTVPTQLGLILCPNEMRGLHFFREKTAYAWSGWQDATFWSELVLQASHIVNALRHALIALASQHECLETDDSLRKHSLREFGVSQGQQALTCLNRDYNKMSISAILIIHIVLCAYAATFNQSIYMQVVKQQNAIVENLATIDKRGLLPASAADLDYTLKYLEPLAQRKMSQDAHFFDLSWNIAQSSASWFRPAQDVTVPKAFSHIKHARDVLEDILKFITHKTKLMGSPTNFLCGEATRLLKDWHETLALLEQSTPLSTIERYSLALLRVCAKVNVVMIQTMNVKDEMAFDQHIDTFAELVTVGEQYMILQTEGVTSVATFGLDPGFVTLLGNAAARWCREPSIRQKLIDLLYKSNRNEGFESAASWAKVCEQIKLIEEAQATRIPHHCGDIPDSARVRVLEGLFYVESDLIRVRYKTAPRNMHDMNDMHDFYLYNDHDVWCPKGRYPSLAPRQPPEELPVLRLGSDYYAPLNKSTNEYNITRSSKFYFPLPRV